MPFYFVGCCQNPCIPLYGSALVYSYDTGNIPDLAWGGAGAVDILVSGIQKVSAGCGKSSVTINGNFDDLCVLVPPGQPVSVSWNSSIPAATVTLPSKYLIINANFGDSTNEMFVGDGTHSATIAGRGDSYPTSVLSGAGFNVVSAGSPIEISLLESLGLSDANGNMQFQLVLVPNGLGRFNISSMAAA